MALVEVRNAGKMYAAEGAPVIALDDISLDIEAGEFIALTGRSGCGKSTLLNLCGAVDFPTSGDVIVDGQNTKRLKDAELTRLRREQIGFVFQSFQLLHTLTAVENVELPLLLARRKSARTEALERMRWVGMEDYAGRPPHQLSGGEQQRIAIARALVHNPKLILADEPTGNLDSATGEVVIELLHRVAREFGAAVLMATHSAEVAAGADRVVHLRDGRVVETRVLEKAGSLR